MTSDEIKQNVTMRQVVERYGLKVNRSGKICCPFHKEKTPSMKIYDRSFYCFGCQIGGDIFKFVQLYEQVDFKTAFQILGGTYGERTFSQKHAEYESRIRQARRQKAEKQQQDERRKCADMLTQLREKIRTAEPLSDKWSMYKNMLEDAERRYDQIVMGGGEE